MSGGTHVLRRILGRTANNLLSRIGLEVVPISIDLGCILAPGKRLDHMFSTTTALVRSWLSSQKLYEPRMVFDVEQEVRGFFHDYMRSPFRNPRGGSRMGNLLCLNLIAKSLSPDLIVDSGTFTGASAWALARGNPRAHLLSFDPDLSRLKLRVPHVEYVGYDWSKYDPTIFVGRTTLCYFDDHIDQWRRLEEAFDRRVSVAVLDDDYTVYQCPPMAHGGASLPKASFLFDDSLKDGEVIEWYEGQYKYDWTVHRPALERVKAMIRCYERLPNVGFPFGIEQIPYSVASFATRQY
jgi:hypothetical protein